MSRPNKYQTHGLTVGSLVAQKQEAYGDSVGRSQRILAILYPDGVSPDHYDDMLLVVRVLDKLSRLATRNDPSGESPWRDIAGYALLALARETQ